MSEPELTNEELEKIVSDYNASLSAPEHEAPYERFMGLAQGSNGEPLAVIKTKPDVNGNSELLAFSQADINSELSHLNHAIKVSNLPPDHSLFQQGHNVDEIREIHGNNQDVLQNSQNQIANTANTGQALLPLDQALEKYGSDDFKRPSIDADFAERPLIGNEPRYTKVVGVAENSQGEPGALIEAVDHENNPHLYFMTEEDLEQQISHDRQAQLTPEFTDGETRRRFNSDGSAPRSATDGRIEELHRNNEGVVRDGLEQMYDKLGEGEALPTLEQAVAEYEQEKVIAPAAPQAPMNQLPSAVPKMEI